MVATYRTLYAMAYAATAVTPTRATIPTSTSVPPCRTVKSAAMGSPVRRTLRRAAMSGPVRGTRRKAIPGPKAVRSSAFHRRASSPAPNATPRHSTVEAAAPWTP